MKVTEAFTYEVKRYKRAKYLRIAVKPGGRVVVTTPWRMPKYVADDYVKKQITWILKAREKMLLVAPAGQKGSPAEYKKYKKDAAELFTRRLQELNRLYGFTYKRVSVRNQQSRWGSCSKSGTLSFSYRLLFVPSEVRDYVFVHELCHIEHMNHSAKFWALVFRACPQYKVLRRQLQEYNVPGGKNSDL